MFRLMAILIAFTLLGTLPAKADEPHNVKLTVVVIYATPSNAKIDEKLTDLAKEIKKTRPDLTGFSLASVADKSVAVGNTGTFNVVEKEELTVKIDKAKGKGKDDKVGLTVAPPGAGEITYSCACGKFVPIMTGVKAITGEQIIVGIMAQPCHGKK